MAATAHANEWISASCSVSGAPASEVDVGVAASPIAGESNVTGPDLQGSVVARWRFASAGSPVGMTDQAASVCVWARPKAGGQGTGKVFQTQAVGHTWVANTTDRTIVSLASDGTEVERIPMGPTYYPLSLARLANGNVLVGATSAAQGEAMLRVLDLDGQTVQTLSSAQGQPPFNAASIVGASQAAGGAPIYVALGVSPVRLVRYDTPAALPQEVGPGPAFVASGAALDSAHRIVLSGGTRTVATFTEPGTFSSLLLTSPVDALLQETSAVAAVSGERVLVGFADEGYGVVVLYDTTFTAVRTQPHGHGIGTQGRLAARPAFLAEMPPDRYLATAVGSTSIAVLGSDLSLRAETFGPASLGGPRGMLRLR